MIRNTRENKKQSNNNFSYEERTALQNKRSDNIVIEPTDKGSAVIFIDNFFYIRSAMFYRKLRGAMLYRKLESDTRTSVSNEMNYSLVKMYIDKKNS